MSPTFGNPAPPLSQLSHSTRICSIVFIRYQQIRFLSRSRHMPIPSGLTSYVYTTFSRSTHDRRCSSARRYCFSSLPSPHTPHTLSSFSGLRRTTAHPIRTPSLWGVIGREEHHLIQEPTA